MKTPFFFLCFGLCCALSATAQQTERILFPTATPQAAANPAHYPEPILLVNGHETRFHAFISAPEDIVSFDVYVGEKDIRKFGLEGEAGVLAVTLKPAIPLARLPELYKAFQVPAPQQQLSLAINGQRVRNPEQLLADLRQIERVEVTAFDPLSPTRWSLAPAYLNIVTKQDAQGQSTLYQHILGIQKTATPSPN